MTFPHPSGPHERSDPRNVITVVAVLAILGVGLLVPELSAAWGHSTALRVTVGAVAGVIAVSALASHLVARRLAK